MSRLLVFLISLFALQAQAATYYVSTSGNNSNSCTSTSTTCATLAGAVGKASNGDTILLNKGDTWTGSSGAASVTINLDNVTIGSYGAGPKPIIDGQNTYPSYDSYTPFIKVRGANVTVKDIHFRNSGGHCLSAVGARNVVFEGNTVEHCLRASIIAMYDKDRLDPTGYLNKYRSTIGFVVRNNIAFDSQWAWQGANDPALLDPTVDGTTNWAGTFVAQSGTRNFLYEGNYAYDNIGETLSCTADAADGIIRNNIVRGKARIGVYLDACFNVTIENNILVGGSTKTWSGRNIAGIAINNEAHNYLRGISTDVVTKNVIARNNLIANYTAGIWIGASGGEANFSDVRIVGNTILRYTTTGLQVTNTLASQHTNSLIANNIFDALDGGGAPASTNIPWSGVTLRNNYWSSTPTGLTSGTGDVVGGLTFANSTNWAALVASTALDETAFIPAGGSSTVDAGAALANLRDYTKDFYGTAYANDIGAFQDGATAPPPPPAIGTAITSLSAPLTPSTAGFRANGAGLSGVYSATVSDSDTTESLVNVYGLVGGTQFAYDTSTLTGIDLDNYTITATLDEPDFYSATPLNWTGAATITTRTGTFGPFTAAAITRGATQAYQRAVVGNISPIAGENLRIEFYVAPDSGTEKSWAISAKDKVDNETTVCYADIGAATTLSSQLSITSPTCTQTTNPDGVTVIALEGVAEDSNAMQLEIGSGSTTKDIVILGARSWSNRTPQTVRYSVVSVPTPTVSNVNGDNVLLPNAENTITGTLLDSAYSVNLSNAGGSIDYPVVIGQDTSAKFRIGGLSPLSDGAATLKIKYGELLYSDFNPRALGNNYGATLTNYTPVALGMANGVTVPSGGETWNSATKNPAFTAEAGRAITAHFVTVPGTSGRFRAVLSNQTTAEYVEINGIFGGGIAVDSANACSSSAVSEHQVGGVVVVALTCAPVSAGEYKISVGPYHTTGDLNYYGVQIWQGDLTSEVTHSVTKTVTGSPEPTLVKKLKLGTPLSKITRNGVPANFTYTSVKVYDKNPATDRTAQVLVELVGPYNVGLQEYEGISVVDGIASATEADVLAGSGSLNALANGTYWVLSSRPSNGTLAISLTNIQLVTE